MVVTGCFYVSWRVVDWVANLSIINVGSAMFYVGGVFSAALAGSTYYVLRWVVGVVVTW